jgi:hypothetical protein
MKKKNCNQFEMVLFFSCLEGAAPREKPEQASARANHAPILSSKFTIQYLTTIIQRHDFPVLVLMKCR